MTHGPFFMLTRTTPLYVAASAAYPYSHELERRCERLSAFEERYNLSRRDGDILHLPRTVCPVGPDRMSDGVSVDFATNFIPRNSEQQRVEAQARALLLNGQNFILQAPTGWGKTVVGCALIGAVGKKTLVITTKEDAVDQWIANGAKLVLDLPDEEIGIWRADSGFSDRHKMVIGLVQSVLKGPERYPDLDFSSFGLIVCDEVHRMGADQFSQAMWWLPARLRLGLSATPNRRDGKDTVFFSHIGPIKVVANQETLIPKVFVRKTGWRVPRVLRNGEYVSMPHSMGRTMHLLRFMTSDVNRNLQILEFTKKAHEKGRTTIVFSDTVDHLTSIDGSLRRMGIPPKDIGYYVGITTDKYTGKTIERKQQREAAKSKPVILATYKMASEATDIPWADTCVLGTPKADVVQIVGRIRREYPDKKPPVVLDLWDTDSGVFNLYSRKRLKWYQSLGAQIIYLS